MFNILQFHLEGRRVLDLYAGSGQLGAEALSRGARECVFVEQSAAAAQIIRENTRFFESRAIVRIAEVIRWLEGAEGRFDIVLLDPPYESQLAAKTLDRLFARDIVNPGGFILCEAHKGAEMPAPREPYSLQKAYTYGDKIVSLFSRGGGIPGEGSGDS
jgi:16S rRNA (guanine(966)-N(2))-methyltransferase RsmD